MKEPESKRTGRGWFSRLRREETWVEISGYRVGDLQLDEPIVVTAGAQIVGDVIAPKMQVAGSVYGCAAALEITVASSGQIWGDIYANELQLSPGGRLRGWSAPLTDDGYQQIRQDGRIPPLDPTADGQEAPDEARGRAPSRAQVSLLRQLQGEAASAVAARVELEQAFDQRLQEMAGEATTRVKSLTEELSDSRAELVGLQEKLADQARVQRQLEQQLADRRQELATTQDVLREKNQELATLLQDRHEQHATAESLRSVREKLSDELRQARQDVESRTKRVNGLETALQANLQHSAEQEDALLRWQELAEATEQRAAELEARLQDVRQQLEQSRHVNERLQEQRRQLQADWQQIQDQLHDSQIRLPELPGRLVQFETEADGWIPSEPGVAGSVSGEAAEFDETAEQKSMLAALRDELLRLEAANQEQAEQLLWYKASLETSRLELEQLRQQTAGQAMIAAGREAGDQTARQLRHQLEAVEAELAEYRAAVATQGQQLAEARAELAEQALTLQRARDVVAKHEARFDELKRVAGGRIKQLQGELMEAHHQIETLTSGQQ